MTSKMTRFCATYLGLLAASWLFFAWVPLRGAFLIAFSAPVHFLCLTGLILALRRERNRTKPPVLHLVTGIVMLLALLLSAWIWYRLVGYLSGH